MSDVKKIIIWGNHSSTQYPDVNHGTVQTPKGLQSIREAVKDDNWLNGEFIKVGFIFKLCICRWGPVCTMPDSETFIQGGVSPRKEGREAGREGGRNYKLQFVECVY